MRHCTSWACRSVNSYSCGTRWRILHFLLPFSPQITIGSYTWRVRPDGSPNPRADVALWLSVRNTGVTPGEITDFIAILSLPKGDWLLTPMFYVDSEAYLRTISRPQDSPDLPATEPFAPLFIPGRGQVSKAILFKPFEGKANRQWMEPGVHKITFYAQLHGGSIMKAGERKIVFEPDVIQN